jgi:SWI/SNF related-matrix-associated actin-dependent regulator of chromatin subfamily C
VFGFYNVLTRPAFISFSCLIQAGILKRPRVFFNKVPVGILNKLSKIVLDHGGSIVTSEDPATHVIDWNEEVDGNKDSVDDFIRVLEVQGSTEASTVVGSSVATPYGPGYGKALVHWWYYPDSFDEWISGAELNFSDPPDLALLYPPTRSKWYVCCRFIFDCEVFNEWGNAADYEDESQSAEKESMLQMTAAVAAAAAAAATSQSDGGAAGGTAKKARGRKRFSQLAVGGAGAGGAAGAAGDGGSSAGGAADWLPVQGSTYAVEKLMADAIPPTLDAQSSSAVEVELLPAGAARSLAGTKRSSADLANSSSQTQTQTQSAAPAAAATVDPPAWYNPAAVSLFEEQMLGLAAEGDAAEYLRLRNAIVALCSQSPLQYLSGTECRRKIPGDVSRILQIHEFLNSFALINGKARREARPDTLATLNTLPPHPVPAAPATTVSTATATAAFVWDVASDAALLAAISSWQIAHGRSAGSSVDWVGVAASVEQAAGQACSPAECARHFLSLTIDHKMSQSDVVCPGKLLSSVDNSACGPGPVDALHNVANNLKSEKVCCFVLFCVVYLTKLL